MGGSEQSPRGGASGNEDTKQIDAGSLGNGFASRSRHISVGPRMPLTPVSELIPVLQMAIGPVILISGVGLLLLTLTNRYARTIDRSRQLVRELRELAGADRARLEGQIRIIYRRARLLRLSILLAAASLLLASVLIIVLFLTALWKLEAGVLISLLFIACMVALSGSLVVFIREMNVSLGALKLELEYQKSEDQPTPARP
jgi:hypothetical protein